jgi:predicted metal-dependent TIM-barrel fold hydrolase
VVLELLVKETMEELQQVEILRLSQMTLQVAVAVQVVPEEMDQDLKPEMEAMELHHR